MQDHGIYKSQNLLLEFFRDKEFHTKLWYFFEKKGIIKEKSTKDYLKGYKMYKS